MDGTRMEDGALDQQMKALPRAVWLGIFGLALALLLGHAWRYYPFVSDDTLISLRYAERLLGGGGLTWNDGEWVEGYSNLLWVLACAGIGLLGVDLVLASRILGVLGMSAAIAALVHHWARRGSRDPLPALFGSVGMALTGPFAVWAVGGLEQPMVVALLAWACVTSLPLLERDPALPLEPQRWAVPGVLYGLLCLTRPDGAIFVGCACATLLAVHRGSAAAIRLSCWLALPSALLLAGQLGFRLVYYGDWVPNTAYSKVALTSHRLRTGLDYFWGGIWPLAGLVLPALAQIGVAWIAPRLRPRTAFWTVPLLVWSAYVIVVGGDIFPGRRHLVVVVALLAFLGAELWHALGGSGSGPARIPTAARWALALGCLALLGGLQWSADRTHLRAIKEIRWAQQGEALGRLLGRAYVDERPLLAATAAGSLPYYSGLPALDMLGLNDRYLAMHPPKNLGSGRIGHELGDGNYFMRREPDLVVFCGTSGHDTACSRGGREMQADPRFERRYRLVTFLGKDPIRTFGKVWVREWGGTIGIRVEADGNRIRIPGELINDERGTPATLDEQGRIGALIRPGKRAVRGGLGLAPGRWRAEALANGPVSVSASLAGAEAPLASGAGEIAFELPGPGSVAVDWVVRAENPASAVHLRELVLIREATTGLSRTPRK
jgi:hypothetical protein